jgi:hypothetical protein
MTAPTATSAGTALKSCRFCGADLRRTFVDLGMSPLCETYPSQEDLSRGEMFYPLHTYVCEKCFLVQLDEFETRENIFGHYLYFSSYSDSWLKHAKNYCYAMAERFTLDARSFVVEVASNDGYLLQYFVEQGVPVLGIEPAANVAEVAVGKGVPTLVRFFGAELAADLVAQGQSADLIAGNNVLAQVPGPERFRRRAQDPAEAGRRSDARVPAPAATHRTQRVRHHLSRALFVFFDAHHRAHP